MDLTEQKLSGINEIHLTDSLNAALLEIKLKRLESTVAPNSNELVIYVDKQPSTNPSENRKQYLFEIERPLQYLNGQSDEFIVQIDLSNNDIFMKTYVKRLFVISENSLHLLGEAELENLDNTPVTLFDGENYIYTNYENLNIELIYPKNNDLNKQYLNNSIYFGHKSNNTNEFSLDDIYFKDAFTKTENDLNLEIYNLNVDSITSKNNKFSLDTDGNLVVNSITSSQNILGNQSICDLIYPVGSIYLSVDGSNPSLVFGGAWEQIKDRFLLGAGDTYNSASTGGAANHTISVAELPKFTPSGSISVNGSSVSIGVDHDSGYGSSGFSVHGWANKSGQQYTFDLGAHSHSASFFGNQIGGDSSFSIMPPYLTVYMWKRIS